MNYTLLITLLNSRAYNMGYLAGQVIGVIGVGVLIYFLVRKRRK
jgi:hypothetical protein